MRTARRHAVLTVLWLLSVAACAPAPRPPAVRGAPAFQTELEDSTTLWLLEIDPEAAGVSGWTPGGWATYEIGVRRGPGAVVRRITYKALEAEARGTWIEVREELALLPGEPEGPRGPRGAEARAPLPAPRVVQYLLPFGPIQRARMVEMLTLDPDGGVRRSAYVERPEARDRTGFPGTWRWVGEEELETPGGRVRTHHYRKGATNLWVSGGVPLLGLVRAAGRGPLINLVDWGTEGATSSIPR